MTRFLPLETDHYCSSQLVIQSCSLQLLLEQINCLIILLHLFFYVFGFVKKKKKKPTIWSCVEMQTVIDTDRHAVIGYSYLAMIGQFLFGGRN